MDSREILRQYITGAMRHSDAINCLKGILVNTAIQTKPDEIARANYVIGFIRRVSQFKCGEASENDLCLNIRDLCIIIGRIKLSESIYKVVEIFGKDFGLVCENDLQVSCITKSPDWLEPQQYIRDVYSFKRSTNTIHDTKSSGDGLLRSQTSFTSYKSFEQKIAIHSAVNLPLGHTLLVSLPTGSGKSLITQILSSASDGLTIVIVPTVALALDQYHAAKSTLKSNRGILCYHGEQTELERIAIIKSLKNHSARILFTSPEAIIKNQELYLLLDRASQDRYITNVIIDEAHVVPDWGAFFRPDFQLFSILLKKWRKQSNDYIRTYMLSATLSDDVVNTLFSLFGSDNHNAQIRCDALRQEPRFYFKSVKSVTEQTNKTIEAICLMPKPMVVYVLEPREAKEIQKQLRQVGFLNIPIFTGETKEVEREKILIGWKNHEYDVVIATSAFGIGVDKSDVRTIIHACCPENLSRFYQEVGRAGRDGFPSISLFMPYKSKYDQRGDVRRALGLANKRVLTVQQAVNRWNGLVSKAIIDVDICIMDTSATPPTMTDEESDVAGNRNVAWNINLLLFLHRIGFIELLDTNYVIDNYSKRYTVTIKLIKPDVLSDDAILVKALTKPRDIEYKSQISGYRIIRNLVSSPNSKCWGRIFKHLYPLSRDVCSGCPVDHEGRITTDDTYKLRVDPDISLPAKVPSTHLNRIIGDYRQLVVKRKTIGPCTLQEAVNITEKANLNEIGALVAPKRFVDNLEFDGILFDYDEFYFASVHCPYLFANGIVCIFDDEVHINTSLFRYLEKLDAFGYLRILYCNDKDIITTNGKTLRENNDGYTIWSEKF